MADQHNLIIVCSSGPSLARHYDTIKSMMPCRSVIAVNRAAEMIACNWWVFLDWQCAKLWMPASTQCIHVTRIKQMQDIMRNDQWMRDRMRGRSLCDLHVCFPHLPPQGKVSHSGIAGVAWAVYVAVTCAVPEIHLFGFDMAGTRDYRNETPDNHNSSSGHGRSDGRWKRERQRIALLARYAHGCGIRIKRWK